MKKNVKVKCEVCSKLVPTWKTVICQFCGKTVCTVCYGKRLNSPRKCCETGREADINEFGISKVVEAVMFPWKPKTTATPEEAEGGS